MAPALGRPVPPTDVDGMRAVLGTWWFDEAGGLAPSNRAVAAHVTAPALTFPDWGTQRSSWRDSDVEVTGDTELAARFLDTVNVI
ncbi:hypothetical protein ACH4HG_36365 [Streptomyces coeruleorubidus]|uniref:hypothetical protein n=1 Tax=Streptomyces coeruleorubidus TaxID=116188 RepID=UPI0037B5CC12